MNESIKFKNIPLAPGKGLHYISNSEKRVTDILKSLKKKNTNSKRICNKLRPSGWNRERFMDQLKCINPSKMDCRHADPFFQRLVITTHPPPLKNWQNFKFPICLIYHRMKFTVKDSFSFVDEIFMQNNSLHMTSLDLVSLFTNIPFDETNGICIN